MGAGGRSALHAAHGHAFDEVALEHEEEEDHGEGHEDVGGHEEGPVDAATGGAHVGADAEDAEGEGELALVAEVDEGAQEFVPGAHDGHDGDGGGGGGYDGFYAILRG
jgi:hypothetical protein